VTNPVRIPADVDRPDRVLGPLTARQLTILGVAGIVLYALYTATRAFLPLPVFLIVAIPVAVAVAVIALGQRDGLPMDTLLVAAIRQRLAPAHRVCAPEGVRPAPAWLTAQRTSGHDGGRRSARQTSEPVAPAPLELPATAVSDTGVVDLGSDGLAVIAVCSTVNFSLRTPAEQEALVGSFARYLHSLTAPIQILVRAERLDLTPQIAELRHRAGGLPHPALEAAARDHADYLADLSAQTDLLRRQVLLVLREPLRTRPATPPTPGGPRPPWRRHRDDDGEIDGSARQAAEGRLVRRLGEAVELLSPAGIVVTGLDAATATGVLTGACNPDTYLPPSAGLAGSDEVVTSTTTFTDLYSTDEQAHSPRSVPPAAEPAAVDGAPWARRRTAPARTAPPEASPSRETSPSPRTSAASASGPWLSEDDDWDYDDELAAPDTTTESR
jgi:hypothetical protein